MRRTNINAVLRMVREYLNGDMNEIDFYLDFPYEIEKRYQKMCREDPDYTDMIYYYLVTDFVSRLRSAAGILLPLNTRTLLLYPGGRDCIGAAGVDAYNGSTNIWNKSNAAPGSVTGSCIFLFV